MFGRRGGWLVIAALTLAGCQDAPAAAPTPSPTPAAPSPATATPTPTPTPTPVVDDPLRGAPPPELDLVGHADPERIVRSHQAYRTWLFANPDPEGSALIAHPDCRCHDTDVRLLTYYQAEGLWWSGDRDSDGIEAIEVIDDWSDDLLHVRVTLRRDHPSHLVDEAGEVHDELPREVVVLDYIYVRDNVESPWLLRDFTERDRQILEGA